MRAGWWPAGPRSLRCDHRRRSGARPLWVGTVLVTTGRRAAPRVAATPRTAPRRPAGWWVRLPIPRDQAGTRCARAAARCGDPAHQL